MNTERMSVKRAAAIVAIAVTLGTTGAVTLEAVTAAPAAAATAECEGWGRHVWAKQTSGGGVTMENCSLYAIRVQPKFGWLNLSGGWTYTWEQCRTINARMSSHWDGSALKKYASEWRYC